MSLAARLKPEVPGRCRAAVCSMDKDGQEVHAGGRRTAFEQDGTNLYF